MRSLTPALTSSVMTSSPAGSLTCLCLLKVSGSSGDSSSANQSQMAVILSEAFQAMRVELNGLPLGPPSMMGELGESKMTALLEEYSLLLLQAVQRRLDAPLAAPPQ